MVSKKLIGLLAGLLIAPAVGAQPPALPGAPAAPAAPTSNLWSFLCPTPDQKLAWKTCFCNSPIGQMLGGMAGPASTMSGGLLPNCCQQTSLANDLKKSADSPDGMAARAKKDAEECKGRRAAVRYLGTLDCNYWPDAVDVLITSLRMDRSECVRFEAALALQNGCCCNAKIVKALTISVTGGTDDGFPAEHSDRVRAAAADALSHCVLPAAAPQKEGDKEQRNVFAPIPPVPTDPTAYYKAVSQQVSREDAVENARAVLAQMQTTGRTPAVVYPISNQQRRPGSVADIFSNAFMRESRPVVASAAPAPAKAQAPYSQTSGAMPGTPIGISNTNDRLPVSSNSAPVVSTPTTGSQTSASQPSAPRRQSLYSILSQGWSRPQAANPSSEPEPQPLQVSNPVPVSPSTGGSVLPVYAPRPSN